MSNSVARATGAVYPRAWRQAVYAFFILAGTIVGQQWGVSGAAAGVVIALTINFLLMTQRAWP
jgi:PST family polysaccharide transporter